jgi:hypothetical protein
MRPGTGTSVGVLPTTSTDKPLFGLTAPSAASAQVGDPATVPVSDTFEGITVLSQRERGDAGPSSDRYFLVQEVTPVDYRRLPVAHGWACRLTSVWGQWPGPNGCC